MYSEEFKEQVLKLYLEQRRTIGSLADEFGLSKSGINKWIKQYRENAERDEKLKQALETMEENRRLHQKIEELEKENDFLIIFFIRPLGDSDNMWVSPVATLTGGQVAVVVVGKAARPVLFQMPSRSSCAYRRSS